MLLSKITQLFGFPSFSIDDKAEKERKKERRKERKWERRKVSSLVAFKCCYFALRFRLRKSIFGRTNRQAGKKRKRNKEEKIDHGRRNKWKREREN